MRLPPGPPFPGYVTVLPSLYYPYAYFEACAKRWPDAFSMRIPGMKSPAVVFSHPDVVKEVFSLGPDDVLAGKANEVLGPLVGKYSLLLLDGAEHLRQRKLLLPPLHGERMAAFGERMIRLTEASIARWPERTSFPVHGHLQTITLDVILRVVFGLDEGEKLDRMRKYIVEIMELVANPLLLFPMFQKELGGLSPWGRFRRAVAESDAVLFDEIRERRASGRRTADILSLLLDARDEVGHPMSEQELRDELVTLLGAGHETTATGLAWALRWVLASPSLVARLGRELEELGALEDLSPDKLARAPLLDATVREALRLQPVVPMVGRVLQRPMHLGGYDLDEGTTVLLSIYLVHRRPDLYPDPTRFDPDRFMRQKFSPSEWLPFGGGIRRCIGMAFAMYEMKMILGTILARTALRLPTFGKVREVRRSITITPSGGMPVVLERKGRSLHA